MRSYIISELQKEQEDKQADYNKNVAALKEQKKQLEVLIFNAKTKSQTVIDLTISRNSLLYQLADLNDEESIFECDERNLFKCFNYEFPAPQEWQELTYTRDLATISPINCYKPCCYQQNFFHMYHEKRIQPLKMERFDDFIKRAKEKGSLFEKPAAVQHVAMTIMS